MDLSVFETLDGGDVVVKGNDLELVSPIFNQVYLALFGGNIEQSTDDGTSELLEREDWFGNELFFQEDRGQQFNSNFERALNNVALTSNGLLELETIAKEDLRYIKDLAKVTINISLDALDRIRIEINLQEPGNLEDNIFVMFWDETRKEEIITDDFVPTIIPLEPGFEEESLAVFARMPTLTEDFKTAINTFIVAEKLAGTNNYAKYDEFFCISLGAINGVTGFFNKTATINGGATFPNVNGVLLNGTTGYLDTLWIPSVDGNNYTKDDALVGAFFYDKTGTGTIKVGFGVSNPGSEDQIIIFNGASQMFYGTNCSSNTVATGETPTQYGNQKLFIQTRTSSSVVSIYKDGNKLEDDTGTSTNLPTDSVIIGGWNLQGTPQTFYDGTISTFIIASAIGFDHAAHNTNVRQLLTDLGVTLT